MTKRKEIAGVTLIWLNHDQIIRLVDSITDIDKRMYLKQWLFSYFYLDNTKEGSYVPEYMVSNEIKWEIQDDEGKKTL